MSKVKELWEKFVGFLKEYTFQKSLEAIQVFEWRELVSNPIFWIVSVPLAAILIFRKMVRTTVFLISLVLLVILVQKTAVPQGSTGTLPAENMLLLITGIACLILLNAYFAFVYHD